MRCAGRTNSMNRCKMKNIKWFYPFCKYHWWQPFLLIFLTVPAIFNDYHGIYQTTKEMFLDKVKDSTRQVTLGEAQKNDSTLTPPKKNNNYVPSKNINERPLEKSIFKKELTLNLKDVRVARELNSATLEFVLFLGGIIGKENQQDGDKVVKLFREAKINDPLDTSILEELIMPHINSRTLLSYSGININNRPVSWAEYLIVKLDGIINHCNTILDWYAERDEQLVENVHLIRGESSNIRNSIILSLKALARDKDTILLRLHKEQLPPKKWMEDYIKTVHDSRKKCYEFYDEG